MRTNRCVWQVSVLFLFFLHILLFLIFAVQADASPPPIFDVEGNIYEPDGITPIWRSVNISMENLNSGAEVKGWTSKADPSHFKISLGGNSGDQALLKVWNREHQNNKTLTLGVVRNESMTLSMEFQNYAPEFHSAPPPAAVEDELYTYDIDVEDYNFDAITLALDAGPQNMALSGRKITWTPVQEDVSHGPYTIRINATDGALYSYQSYTLSVANVNDAPVIESYPEISAKETESYNYQIVVRDDDNDVLNYTLITGPAGLSLDDSGLASWTPASGEKGKYLVSFSVADSNYTAYQEYILFVGPKNNSDPQITSTPPSTANINDMFTYTVASTDADGDGVIYELFDSPEDAYMIGDIVYWIPSSSDINNSPALFVVRAIDTKRGSSAQVFYVNVTNISAQQAADEGGSSRKSVLSAIGSNPDISNSNGSASNISFIRVKGIKSGKVFLYHMGTDVVADVRIAFASGSFKMNEAPALLYRSLDHKPAGLESPQNLVYKYFELKLSGGPVIMFNATITFMVTNEYLGRVNISPEDMRLLRYRNGTWNRLETNQVSVRGSSSVFEAKASGFSYFAVSTIQKGAYPQTRKYLPSPVYNLSALFNLTGIIYTSDNKTQVGRMTQYVIINNNTKKQYRGYTGMYDLENTGSFSSMILAKAGDTIIVYVHSQESNMTYKHSFVVPDTADGRGMNTSIYTNMPTPLSRRLFSALLIVLLACISFLLAIRYMKIRPAGK